MSTPQPPRKPCFQFRRGKCKFGARCKFSHYVNDQTGNQLAGPSTTRQSQRPNPGAKRDDGLLEWKHILWQARRSPSRTTSDRFFELAVKLLDGELDTCQEAVRLFSQEDGLIYIRLLVEKYIPNAVDSASKQDLWIKQMQPLFTLVTHHRVVDSAVLEQQVAGIYNFMQGIGSQRMKRIFDFAINLAQSVPTTSQSASGGLVASKPVMVETCLAVLSKMVDCNTNNIVDETFKTIVEQLASILTSLNAESDNYVILQSHKWLRYINCRLGIGDELPSAQVPATQSVGSRAQFALPKNLPGHLSASGRRHDNDHADIRNIKILPTHDEIVSARGEYLPSNDPSTFHLPGIMGRLDREFRLLREDQVGQLRDAVRDLVENQQTSRQERPNLSTNIYEDMEPVRASFERFDGIDLLMRFPQRKGTVHQRRDWWSQSKRLQPGALVCIISRDGSILFCVVGKDTVVAGSEKQKRGQHSDARWEEIPEWDAPSLADDEEFAYFHLSLAEPTNSNLQQALCWFQHIGPKHQRYLVEFPGVLLASFQYTLEALQRMSRAPDMPFIDLIAPVTPSAGIIHVPPPQYATRAGFYFDLECLAKDGTKLRVSPTQHLCPKILSKHSTLDETQSSALLDSLSRGLALIQGPPGTGKSYTGEKIIKVLLANQRKENLGPIICICYTNHALDQLLEHLLDDGVQKIIRIGSRSKSERLGDLNLRAVARSADRTKSEKSVLWETNNQLEFYEDKVSDSLEDLEDSLGRPALQAYLSKHHPEHHKALFERVVDEDGFEKVQRRSSQLVDQWLHSGHAARVTTSPRPVEQLITENLWTMTHAERTHLYDFWLRSIRDPIIQDIMQDHDDYVRTKSKRGRVVGEVDLRCLSAAEVVGVTTTGLARNIDLLRKLRCKVLICEEAGEVLEAHNLTALLPSIEHCILIGDHLQLRPQVQDYNLSCANPRGAEYSLDVSMFERLVKPPQDESQRLPLSTLDTQRRMHPSISELIRRTLYPSLVDGGIVANYPEVLGMKKRLFWFQHTVPEDRAQRRDPTSKSHTNLFEVHMTVALVQHLVRQGTYGPDDIAVITPYLGQLQCLRRGMQNLFQISVGDRDLEELAALDADKASQEEASHARAPNALIRTTLLKSIRLATVDNFQGEEAKVVVISLVRSNNERRCGFLSTPNRINVLLSRAKHGMYVISNSDTYERIPMWAKVINMLRDQNSIGPTLELQCPRHPGQIIEVSTPDNFLQFSPEGGCHRQCDQRLSCGHACINRCHSPVLHSAVKCLESCPRPKQGCDHRCRLPCGDACDPKCMERLNNLNITLSCGHQLTSAFCWQSQDPSSVICKEPVVKSVPGCNHSVTVCCDVDVSASSYLCTQVCGDPLPCGHSCHGGCHICKDRKDDVVVGVHHKICRQVCKRAYTACRHTCKTPCHGDAKCPPCSNPCEVRCSHSKCSKKCHEPCAPCAEQDCSSACPHQKCSMPCAAPCDWIPCSRRCVKTLSCGHQCPSLCGEACPDHQYCQICCVDKIKATIVDFIMGMQYQEVDLDEDPCIFPDCGHFITKTNMDGLMDLKAHYDMPGEDNSNPVALSRRSMPFSMDEIKTCPSCRGSLRNIARYGRIVRRAMLDEATKKFIAWSHSSFLKLADELVNVQITLAKAGTPVAQRQQQTTEPPRLIIFKGRLQQLQLVSDWVGNSRYKHAIQLWNKIREFISQVRKEEQPLQRVADHVRHATMERKITGAFTFDESDLQVKGVLQASALSLKCEIVILTDFMAIREPLIALRPEIKLDLTKQMTECEKLISMAKSTNYPREQAEVHIYLAQLYAFARAFTPGPSGESTSTETSPDTHGILKDQGMAQIAAARDLLARHPFILELQTAIEAAEKMLLDSVFYTEVSEDEIKAVYRAMAREFSGTGHWYRCANGHPFTIGECGMPMEQARCPECGSSVGGTNHRAVEGVRRAHEIEALATDLNRMGM